MLSLALSTASAVSRKIMDFDRHLQAVGVAKQQEMRQEGEQACAEREFCAKKAAEN
jgi:hypothetical protein